MTSAPRRLLAACLMLAASGGLALAQGIEYHQSYDEALAAAKERKQFVMVVVTAPGCAFCTKLKEEVLTSEPIVKLVGQYFAPVIVDLAEVRQGKAKLPQTFVDAFLKAQQIGVPFTAFCDARGNPVTELFEVQVDAQGTKKKYDRIPGAPPAEQYHTVLKMISGKVVAQVPPKDRRDVERALRRSQEAFNRDDFRTAFEALQAALGGGVPGEDLDMARRMAAEIESKALVAFEDGRALEVEGKTGSAIRAYRACLRDFKGTKAADQATERLKALRDDPDLRRRLHDYMARKLVAQAKAAMEAGKYGDASEAVDRALENYPKAAAAAEAKALRSKLDTDPAIAAQVREAQIRADAERLLRLADGYRRNGVLDQALALCRQVVEKYPGTSFAQAAQERITEISVEIKHK